jgi:hypothetical protein
MVKRRAGDVCAFAPRKGQGERKFVSPMLYPEIHKSLSPRGLQRIEVGGAGLTSQIRSSFRSVSMAATCAFSLLNQFWADVHAISRHHDKNRFSGSRSTETVRCALSDGPHGRKRAWPDTGKHHEYVPVRPRLTCRLDGALFQLQLFTCWTLRLSEHGDAER